MSLLLSEVIFLTFCIHSWLGNVLPLLNVTSFGWTEDGRCSSYTPKAFPGVVLASLSPSSSIVTKPDADENEIAKKKLSGTISLTQLCPRPISSLRAAPIPVTENYDEKSPVANKRRFGLINSLYSLVISFL